MQREGVDALKRMAQMAKNRLRNKVKDNDNKKLKNKSCFRVLYGSSVDIKSKIISREDLKLYEKVKAILNEDKDIFNPISRLIDHKVYNKLETNAKERYLFDIVDKYKKYKEMYEEEKHKCIV